MKSFLGLLVGLSCLACLALAGGTQDSVYLGKITNVSTNASASASTQITNDLPLYGSVEAVIVNLSGTEASPDVDIDVTTLNTEGSKITTTIYTEDDVTADAVKPVRIPSVTTSGVTTGTTNSYAKIPLVGDKIVFKVYDANTNAGVNAEAWLIIRK